MTDFAKFCPRCYEFFRDPDKYQEHVEICGKPQAPKKPVKATKSGGVTKAAQPDESEPLPETEQPESEEPVSDNEKPEDNEAVLLSDEAEQSDTNASDATSDIDKPRRGRPPKFPN